MSIISRKFNVVFIDQYLIIVAFTQIGLKRRYIIKNHLSLTNLNLNSEATLETTDARNQQYKLKYADPS